MLAEKEQYVAVLYSQAAKVQIREVGPLRLIQDQLVEVCAFLGYLL